MKSSIALVTPVVEEYNEAIQFYTQKLNFELVEDTRLDKNKRWVTVWPKNSNGFSLLLAKAVNKNQRNAIRNQTGGRVFLFLNTDDFYRGYKTITLKEWNLRDNQKRKLMEY